MERKRVGLLLMSYGTPKSIEEVEPYYTHIRHGRKPTPELLSDLISRYQAIGDVNHFAQITDDQVTRLTEEMNQQFPNVEFVGYLGLKHAHPFIEDAVTQMHQDGITEAISLVLAPHYSTFSVKIYNERAKQKADELGGLTIHSVDSWYQEARFIQFWEEGIRSIIDSFSEEEREKTVVIFSAHSLPERILKSNDPYPAQLEETAKLIAEVAAIPHYAVGWQSAGRTPEPWLGPDVQDLTRDLATKKGYNRFVYCPVGFVAEHLEVLYDNDVECKAVTDELGASYYRPPMPNAGTAFIQCLSEVVTKKMVSVGVISCVD
ncbi:ferrochelatase [Risungbinella massiliensis]|uniref:ferrochelatase n=1 Tax=Risungbinella massiliensis TaxID=1329796 RepID=UPI0005CB8FC4|nr:ferrochelatase [Risungbinella massiliensis]